MTIWHSVREEPPEPECYWVIQQTRARAIIGVWAAGPEGLRGWYYSYGHPMKCVSLWAKMIRPEPPEEGALLRRARRAPFRCVCGCNVFTFPAQQSAERGIRYRCHACGAVYERALSTPSKELWAAVEPDHPLLVAKDARITELETALRAVLHEVSGGCIGHLGDHDAYLPQISVGRVAAWWLVLNGPRKGVPDA